VILLLTASLLFIPNPEARRFMKIENAFALDLSAVDLSNNDPVNMPILISFRYPYLHSRYMHRFLGLTSLPCKEARDNLSVIDEIYFAAVLQYREELIQKAIAAQSYDVNGELIVDYKELTKILTPYRNDFQDAHVEVGGQCKSDF